MAANSFPIIFFLLLISSFVSQSQSQFETHPFHRQQTFHHHHHHHRHHLRRSSSSPTPTPTPNPNPNPNHTPRSSPSSSSKRQLTPALFVIGDSTVDAGTNNFLGTLARADREPYGRDFDSHLPTGRFSNGRIIVDYLAERLGLPFVPPFLGQSGRIEDMIHGMNYASAAAGILSSSGDDLGQHISLTQQIQQVTDTFQQFELSLGETAAADLISRSIFYISIGSNDFIHYYFRNESNVQTIYHPWEFSLLLVSSVREEIQNLYNLNSRKLVIVGLAPIGCTPHYLSQYGRVNGECVDEINNVIEYFNSAMKYMVSELNHDLPDATVTFCDVFEGSMDILTNSRLYGFETTTDACCGEGEYRAMVMCLAPDMACGDARTYVWWDEFHPTEAVNRIIADNVWYSLHTNICHPMNLQDMIRLDLNITP